MKLFKKRVKDICDIYLNGDKLNKEGLRVVSTDEKTGIQAIQRKYKDIPMKHGKTALREYEYIRHGTLSLIAARDITNGEIVSSMIRETRKEQDFLEFIQNAVAIDSNKKWLFIADQLNTHLSASLVEWIAKQISYKGSLGKKGVKGILKNKASRKKFLENKKHKIRFLFTPKHCSWMNQIEVWFNQLSSHILVRGDFKSKQDLKDKIINYIKYYDKYLAKPYNWKYNGKKICYVFNN